MPTSDSSFWEKDKTRGIVPLVQLQGACSGNFKLRGTWSSPPSPLWRNRSGEGGKLQVPRRTHHKRRNSASSTSGDWRNLAWPLKPSQTFTDAQLRASFRVVSPPGTATAPPATAGLSRGWCGLLNASPGANYLASRTPTAPDVTGSPKRSSRTSTTRATACSPHYHPIGEVSTGASKLGHQSPSDC